MEFNKLGYFQFNNLIQNRIPIILIVLDEVTIKPWYNSLVGMHLDNISIAATSENALLLLQERKLPVDFAVIVLDRNGIKSEALVSELEKRGHINVFSVTGGFESLEKERAADG